LFFGVALEGNGGADTALAGQGPVGVGVVSFVGHDGAGLDVGAEVEQGGELPAVALFPSCQREGERHAVEIGLEVDLGREASARTAERLRGLPPLAPAAET